MAVLHLHLPSPLREDAERGDVNIVNRIAKAVAPSGYHLAFWREDEALGAEGLHLLHMQEPAGSDTLNLRRAYTYPFWQIEATNQRWAFDVAKARFDPSAIDPDQARPFFRRWREKFLGPEQKGREGFIFMPLQGRLSEHRSFQSMNPFAMIEATLAADPKREIRATLHPRETYGAADLARLEALSARYPRFQCLKADARDLIWACDYVVTQNSAVALQGYFAKKPAVLFAGIDFHHIAGSVLQDGVETAFAGLDAPRDFAAYLFWFFKQNCVNGGAPEAEAQILARFRRHGWPV
jgi:hypothetical protein